MLNIVRRMVLKDIKKRRLNYPSHAEYQERLKIPCIDDGDRAHQFDVYYANENKKNDFVEIADAYLKNKLAAEKLDIEKIKLRQEKELKERELDIKEKEAENNYKKAITAKQSK